jgi:hypothetical protein
MRPEYSQWSATSPSAECPDDEALERRWMRDDAQRIVFISTQPRRQVASGQIRHCGA